MHVDSWLLSKKLVSTRCLYKKIKNIGTLGIFVTRWLLSRNIGLRVKMQTRFAGKLDVINNDVIKNNFLYEINVHKLVILRDRQMYTVIIIQILDTFNGHTSFHQVYMCYIFPT